MGKKLLCCKDVFVIIDNRPLFKPINFSLLPGDCLQISGKNGSGKTSLLRAIIGLKGYEGEISKNSISYIGHKNNLYLNLTVGETIKFWGVKNKPTLLKNIAEEQLVKNLSFGQRRKLAWVRLLSQKRAVWLLDEPLTNLDIEAQRDIINKVRRHLACGGAIILVTHLEGIWQDIINKFIKIEANI